MPMPIQQYAPKIMIIALGANDGLRGLSLKRMHINLALIVDKLQQHQIQPLSVGMHVPANYGPEFSARFLAIYPTLAHEKPVIVFVPFLLEGVAMDRRYIQPDGLHPTALAQPVILDNVWRVLESLISSTANTP